MCGLRVLLAGTFRRRQAGENALCETDSVGGGAGPIRRRRKFALVIRFVAKLAEYAHAVSVPGTAPALQMRAQTPVIFRSLARNKTQELGGVRARMSVCCEVRSTQCGTMKGFRMA